MDRGLSLRRREVTNRNRTWRIVMKRLLVGLSLLAALLVSGVGRAVPPNADLNITPESGAWMICVASYRGAEAPQMAQQLAQEVRNNYRLPAYVFNRSDEE